MLFSCYSLHRVNVNFWQNLKYQVILLCRACADNAVSVRMFAVIRAEMEPGLRVAGQQFWSDRVTGQCVRHYNENCLN